LRFLAAAAHAADRDVPDLRIRARIGEVTKEAAHLFPVPRAEPVENVVDGGVHVLLQ
jgi:hypothetical protein